MRQINLTEERIIALFIVIVVFCAFSASSETGLPGQTTDAGIGLTIEKRTNELRSPSKVIGGDQIYSSALVERFYKARNYQPAWSHNGRLLQTEELIKTIEEVYGDGLTPDNYHLSLIKSLSSKAAGKEAGENRAGLADLDILLTDSFLTLGCQLSGGCSNPVIRKSDWFAERQAVDVSSLLEQALRGKQIKEVLLKLRPEQGQYYRLRQALARYRELLSKGKWPLVSAGPSLRKKATSERVLALRKRLVASGDLEADAVKGGDLFDEKLEQAVIGFQQRHGLKTDGVVGRAVLDALNVPLEQRIRQIELNLERMRWIPGSVEQSSVIVNIPNFGLDVMEKGKPVLSMKVVVGKPLLPTPVFSAKMTYLVINPSWDVPPSIAQKEVLKKIKSNPEYIAKQDFRISSGRGAEKKEVDPETIDWSGVEANTLPYHFRQKPGPLNPLGHIKFMLPNRFDVYLHDTNSRRLFAESVRTFSHGCIRIEKPLELGEYVLRDAPGWTREKLSAAIQKGTEQTVMIPRPLDVHFIYLTVWVDEAGVPSIQE